jgi:hypothetical protein
VGPKAERITDPAELRQVRRQARQVQVKALVAGLLLTAATLLL